MKDNLSEFYTSLEAAQRFKDFTHAIVFAQKSETDETAKK